MKIQIPLIKNIAPEFLAQELCSVQLMTSEHTSAFKLKHEVGEPPFKEGTVRHEFLRGWTIKYGDEWIPMDLWWKIKISGVLK